MIPKKSINPSDIKSFRPISITLCIARLFERIILNRLQEHLSRNNIIIAQQSGFRKCRQTKDNLITLAQKAQEALNIGEKQVNIFFDIASAFDKVWHHGLLYKLIETDCPYYLVKIIETLISGRQFCVKVGDVISEKRDIQLGVPQGAVLSPTLFSVFINDIPITNEKGISNTLLFADDVMFQCKYSQKTTELENSINLYLKRLELWANNWRLSFAPAKCCYTIFSRNKRQSREDTFHFKMYGEKIPKEVNPVFLGIKFDPYLNFSKHVEATLEKACNRLNIIKILSHNKTWRLSTATLVRVYTSFIRSLFEYKGFTFNHLSEGLKKEIRALENNALRIILHKKRQDCLPSELHNLANLCTFDYRLVKITEKYFAQAINHYPIIQDLVQECKVYHQNILISKD